MKAAERMLAVGLRAVGASTILPALRPGRLTVVAYHHVYDDASPDPQETTNPFFLGLRAFRRQLAWFERHYAFVGAREVAAWLEMRAELPDRPLLLTFDDGYGAFRRRVYPLLRRWGIPALVSPITGWVDGEVVPWDIRINRAVNRARRRLALKIGAEPVVLPLGDAPRRRAAFAFLSRLYLCSPVAHRQRILQGLAREVPGGLEDDGVLTSLTWAEIGEMAAHGIAFGCHTHSHEVLAGMAEAAVREELLRSKKRLGDAVAGGGEVFTYPAGRFSAMVRRQVREVGFRFALRSEGGLFRRGGDPALVTRIGVRGDDTMSEFLFKMSGLRSTTRRVVRGLIAGGAGRIAWRA